MLPTVRFLPVVAAAVATFAIGALWYSPVLFAKAWVKAHGYTEEKIQAMRAAAPRAYGVSFLCYVVVAAAMSVLIHRIGITTPIGGVKLGAVVGIGFAATLGLTANVYSDKPLSAWLIDAGYQVVFLMVMGVILVAWR